MSARDSESGSSSYRGGSGNAGGLGNGGVGGGMGGGHRGGGAGYNGGIGSRTGMTTGKDWYGNTAFGPAGGRVQAFGMRDARSLGRAGMGPTVGSFGNFRTPNGQPMFGNSPVQGQSFRGMNMGQALSQANRAQARQAQAPASVPGLLGGAPVAASAPAYSAVEQEMALPVTGLPLTTLDIETSMYDWGGNMLPGGVRSIDNVAGYGVGPRPYDQRMSPGNVRPAGNYGAVRTGANSSEFGQNQPGGMGGYPGGHMGRPSGSTGYGR
jgi:hypothetical protein